MYNRIPASESGTRDPLPWDYYHPSGTRVLIYFGELDSKIPERCLINSSSASNPASHLPCAHLSALSLAHLQSVQSLAHLQSAQSLAYRQGVLSHAHLQSASRSAHSRTSSSFRTHQDQEG
ncbi:putative small proline-rich protein 2J [Prionailurus bengalensis]|uniref:putative small proline-rich protein 2J n=1 Tax=Prionailurus bengalensis TaxID=37029 RepID=UPI001CA9B237|nr:putative small proline-rich protein 2J [Prionailurus bengalensis]XP_043429292.1 putative small proline-rich protein 2J [Prionailurus bengalensis]